MPQGIGFSQLRRVLRVLSHLHWHPVSRVLHYIGTWGAILCVIALISTGDLWFLLAALFCGYSFAWFGHFIFERNRPATFRYPLYSFASDFRMWWELNLGRLKFREYPTD